MSRNGIRQEMQHTKKNIVVDKVTYHLFVFYVTSVAISRAQVCRGDTRPWSKRRIARRSAYMKIVYKERTTR